MKYDRSTPIAVFLGPSLDEASARAILPANYYPPVKMGDVYRLVSCGVRLIVIIDGVFHGTTPVWQREIVAAIDNGIKVVGASSMGALRAVELEPLGMIGLGTIVDWYRSGRIDGDDEVSLQHADGDYGYRALSEPLVNIRWNLDRAANAGVITDEARDALTAAMHALEYGRRAYPSLFATAAFAGLPAETQAALRTFLLERAENLKQADARAALAWCAERLPALLERSEPRRHDGRAVERADELLLRGVPSGDGTLVPIGELLSAAVVDRERVSHSVLHASRRFYLLEWAARAGVRAPDGVTEAYEAQWVATHGVTDRPAWLVANGLTERELRRELENRAFTEWLIERGPQAMGLDRPFLEAWADAQGIDRPADAQESVAFRAWLVEKMPHYFGFDQWSADVELIRDLQMTGDLAKLTQEAHVARAV